MFPSSHKPFLVFLTVLLCMSCVSKAYDDVCGQVYQSAYCSCDTSHRDTTVTCYIFNAIHMNDSIWDALADVENVVALTLHSRLPFKLSFVPVDTFQKMSTLQTLSIREGNLGQLVSYAVSDLENLKNLELEGNDITDLQPNAISGLPKLERLSLSENLLQELKADGLTGLLELRHLFLDRNNISRIESCAFCELQNLKELELWGNSITDLTEYTFRGLRYLKRLDLYKNQIRILNDKVFHSTPMLMELDLNENLISHIAPRAFHGLHKLQRLLMNSNRLKILPDDVFKSLPSLMAVELYNNLLDTLQVEVVSHMAKAKEEHFLLAFKDNPYRCSCDMQWVRTYLKLNKSHQFARELQEVQCIYDSDKNVTILHYLQDTKCEPRVTTKAKVAIATSRSITKTTVSVPVELNKVLITSEDTAYFSDDDDDHVEKSAIKDNINSCSQRTSELYILACALFLIHFINRRRQIT